MVGIWAFLPSSAAVKDSSAHAPDRRPAHRAAAWRANYSATSAPRSPSASTSSPPPSPTAPPSRRSATSTCPTPRRSAAPGTPSSTPPTLGPPRPRAIPLGRHDAVGCAATRPQAAQPPRPVLAVLSLPGPAAAASHQVVADQARRAVVAGGDVTEGDVVAVDVAGVHDHAGHCRPCGPHRRRRAGPSDREPALLPLEAGGVED